ncbi:Stk1 family PASTA domain-containing Ser/Thr kinase [Lentibacillus sp. N15]|uniref:Stk1 family PASTA domain-containing Ser/Thr kinase n=1 Tax=Lentibacillus songyuanensis TaxID=3136161 RepID=UPI0031BA9AD6
MMNGRLLNERYQIKETIGGGGMANVYLARDIILDRDVAIKVLRLEYANDDEFIARFHREAQSATSLSHPNIVNIYDVGEEDHILYMVMEYVDGMTLKEYIQKYGPIDVQTSLDIMKQISSAITHAHENEIIHRDIKPQNILIDTYGQVKVTDFGIAVALSATSLTQTNSILGSVHYLSPEQARGGSATKKSDIYSLGIVLYELLTGRLPFSGQSPVAIALKHLQNDTPSVRRFNQDIPQSVENIVLKATAKDPFHRYETVYEMEAALDIALDPDKINEERYVPPIEAGEETKAIPIITDDQIGDSVNQDTIVHQTGGNTKPYVEKEAANSDKKKKNKKKEKKVKKSKKKKKKKWLIFLLLLLVAIAAAVVIPVLLQPKEVDVPDVADMDYDDAVAELDKLNLKHKKELMYDDDVDEGVVVKTDPHAGKTVKEDSTVTVFVSQGKETTAFDDYVGEDFSQIEAMLEEEGFEVIGYGKYSDEPEGQIVTQIQPTPDTDVVPSETRVIFEYSNGPELTALNNLKGMTKEEAESYLNEQNFKMNVKEEHSDSVPKGEVIKQDPEPGSKLGEGEAVDVYVSTGPKEKSPASKTINFTVSYNPKEPKDDHQDDDKQKSEEQTVKIYIDDMNHSISDVAEQEAISKDTDFTITLTIAPDDKAEYKVMRDDEVVINKTVTYEEGD